MRHNCLVPHRTSIPDLRTKTLPNLMPSIRTMFSFTWCFALCWRFRLDFFMTKQALVKVIRVRSTGAGNRRHSSAIYRDAYTWRTGGAMLHSSENNCHRHYSEQHHEYYYSRSLHRRELHVTSLLDGTSPSYHLESTHSQYLTSW